MAKVFSIHHFELNPGIEAAEFESESEESHSRYWPEEGVMSEAGQAFVAPWMKKWGTLAQMNRTGATFTDYVVVGK